VGILSLRVTKCKFAVKSGGHGAFSGASNIDGGMTIDLKHLNQLSISHDQAEITIGTGNIWSDVYDYLDPMGLTVVGGRVSDIGVGGLTLGGGISFFSGRSGWACDNVKNYQVRFYPLARCSSNHLRLYSRMDLSMMSIETLIQSSTGHFAEAGVILASSPNSIFLQSPRVIYGQGLLPIYTQRSLPNASIQHSTG